MSLNQGILPTEQGGSHRKRAAPLFPCHWAAGTFPFAHLAERQSLKVTSPQPPSAPGHLQHLTEGGTNRPSPLDSSEECLASDRCHKHIPKVPKAHYQSTHSKSTKSSVPKHKAQAPKHKAQSTFQKYQKLSTKVLIPPVPKALDQCLPVVSNSKSHTHNFLVVILKVKRNR